VGSNTHIMILNDQLSDLERDPERLLAEIQRGLHGEKHRDHVFGMGNGGGSMFVGQTTVFPSVHADHFQVMVSRGNLAIQVGLPPHFEDLSDKDIGLIMQYAREAEYRGRRTVEACADELKRRQA
jgi:hypothetical protein